MAQDGIEVLEALINRLTIGLNELKQSANRKNQTPAEKAKKIKKYNERLEAIAHAKAQINRIMQERKKALDSKRK